MLRIDVSAEGYETRRFYRSGPVPSCKGLSWEPLQLWREGQSHELLPDLLVDPRWLAEAEVARGLDCFDLVPPPNGDGPVSSLCLRFAVGVAKLGVGDLHLTAPVQDMGATRQHIDDGSADGATVEIDSPFINHASHGHVHLADWVRPRLRAIGDDC